MINITTKKTVLVAALALLCFVLPAQKKYTASGKVTDAATGETISGATVFIEGTTTGIATNEYGFYSITLPEGKHTMIVSYVGYQTFKKEMAFGSNQNINIELREQANVLDEVTISATSGSKNISKPQLGVSQLKMETIKQVPVVLGEVDIMKTLTLLPGVSSNGEGAGGLHVRGGAEDQNLVMLDEAIVYNTSHLFGFFSVFNPDAIKDLKLYRGGIPAKFGGRISSVLDVRQKDGDSKHFGMTGGIGALSSRLALEGPWLKQKGTFLLAGRASYAHLFMKFREKEDGGDNAAYFYDVNLKLGFQMNSNNRFFISEYFGRDIFNFSEMFKNTYGNSSFNTRWNHIFNEKVFSNLSFIYSRYDYFIGLLPIKFEWKSDIQNYNLKYDLSYYATNNLKLEMGVSGILYDFNTGEITPTSETSAINYRKLDPKYAQEYGLYASAEQGLGEKLKLQYGLRFSLFRRLGKQELNDYKDNRPLVYDADLGLYQKGEVAGQTSYAKGKNIKTFSNWEPRLVLSYAFTPQRAFKLGFSRTAQYIHLISNTATATPLDVWTPSGRYIQPQLANQYSVGYATNIFSKKLILEAETYYKTVKNRIDYIEGASLIGQNTLETEILSGESRAYGLELLLKKEEGTTTGWLAYTLSKSEQRTQGGKAGGLGINNGEWYNSSYDRTHDLSVTLAHRLNGSWSLGTNFVFQTGRPTTYPNARYEYQGFQVANYAQRNSERLPAYHRLDISATYTPRKSKNKKWKSQWVFGIYNVYNRKNAAAISFGQNPETGTNEATRTAIFGIVPAVTYNFKF